VKTIVKESHKFEEKKGEEEEEEEDRFWPSGDFLIPVFCKLLHTTGHVVGHEALENESDIIIKAYKFTIFERFFVLSYTVYLHYPYI